MWTKTDLQTGQKENRLHRKDTMEMGLMEPVNADHEADVAMTEQSGDSNPVNPPNLSSSNDEVVEEPIEESARKLSPQRMWTTTNLETGQKEGRLHRKDTVELNGGIAGTVDTERSDPEATEDDDDGLGEMELSNSQEF